MVSRGRERGVGTERHYRSALEAEEVHVDRRDVDEEEEVSQAKTEGWKKAKTLMDQLQETKKTTRH